jgi:tetraacyldisaccharide 4'-kinase
MVFSITDSRATSTFASSMANGVSAMGACFRRGRSAKANNVCRAAGEVPMQLRGDVAVALDDPAKSQTLSTFVEGAVHAVAGIGNPRRFFAQLRAANLNVIEHPFSDHHPFTAGDIEFGDTHPVLMTEKDAVKCRAFARSGLWSVPVRAELPQSFFDSIDARLRRTLAG